MTYKGALGRRFSLVVFLYMVFFGVQGFALTDGFDFPFGNKVNTVGWSNTNPFGNDCPGCCGGLVAPYYYHPGEDWSTSGCTGLPIYAVANGLIRSASTTGTICGGSLVIRHDTPEGTVYSVYIHVVPTVWSGDVTRGQQIATISSCVLNGGDAAHLHLEIRRFMANDGTSGLVYPNGGYCGYYASIDAITQNGFLHPNDYINAHRPGSYSNLCGNVSGTLYAAYSPYTLTCPVNVPQGQSLHIEPGVVLNYNGNSFTVLGTLTWGP